MRGDRFIRAMFRSRALRGRTLVLAIALAAVASAVTTSSATAAEFRTGGSPQVKKGETVAGDLYLFGGDADVTGTVTGDAIVSAGTLHVSGKVGGSLSVLAGDVEMTGNVGHSLRVAGGDVTIKGTVGGDVVVAGGSVSIASSATVTGDLIVAGGDVSVLGSVGGDIRGDVGSLTINARVGRNVHVQSDSIRLRSRAKVVGDLKYTSRTKAQIDDGASVGGTTRQTVPARFYPGDNLTSWLGSPIFRLLCALVAGLAIVLLVPRAATVVADGIRRSPAGSFLIGLALLVLIPVLATILLITVIGIPIGLILLAGYVCVLYLSQVFLGLALGRIVLPGSWDTAGRGYNLLAMTIGVIVLAGLRLIPVPFVGTFVAGVTAILGLGAVVTGPRRSRGQAAMPRY